ncbi:septation protein SepH [Arsenicicoccus dermatophilus]|uniref:septation protein SepH n=1 Tax=Arsenicicoccus dermatophilus TaxID=1076331 RepID=UPI001F4CC0F9|nr:septation protein SepH [Arsenicicoccus dermatophilus]MCH8612619.1 septation protein SepH [Arsenicicoccus dermatophilus]
MSVQDLRLVGLADDGVHLLLVDEAGARYRLVLDPALRSLIRHERPRPDQRFSEPPTISPRQVQALIRGGASADEVAELTGWSRDKIAKFEGPIIAEREHVAGLATAVRLRNAAGGAEMLATRVAERLDERGVDAATASWDAWRTEGSPWTLALTFAAGGRLREARWHFDLGTRGVTAVDDEARWLSGDAEGQGPEPLVPLNATPPRRALQPPADLPHTAPPDERRLAQTPPPVIAGRRRQDDEEAELVASMRQRSAAGRRRSRRATTRGTGTRPPGTQRSDAAGPGRSDEESEQPPADLGQPAGGVLGRPPITPAATGPTPVSGLDAAVEAVAPSPGDDPAPAERAEPPASRRGSGMSEATPQASSAPAPAPPLAGPTGPGSDRTDQADGSTPVEAPPDAAAPLSSPRGRVSGAARSADRPEPPAPCGAARAEDEGPRPGERAGRPAPHAAVDEPAAATVPQAPATDREQDSPAVEVERTEPRIVPVEPVRRRRDLDPADDAIALANRTRGTGSRAATPVPGSTPPDERPTPAPSKPEPSAPRPAPPRAQAPAAEAPPQQEPAPAPASVPGLQASVNEPTARTGGQRRAQQRRRAGRPSVPSWDDIMFGSAKKDGK